MREQTRAGHRDDVGAREPDAPTSDETAAWRERTKRRGLAMAMRAAALVAGAGATVGALGASASVPSTDTPTRGATRAAEASPSPTSETSETSGTSETRADEPTSRDTLDTSEPARVRGYSCWGPTSRGPLAPPPQAPDDFAALVARVPA